MTSTLFPQDTPSPPVDLLPSPAPTSASPSPSPAPSENDVDVAREEAAIDAAISQSQQDDDNTHPQHNKHQRQVNGDFGHSSSSDVTDAASSISSPGEAAMEDMPPLSPAPSNDGEYAAPPSHAAAVAVVPAAAPSSASKSRKRAAPAPRPPPVDPSVARATGAKLLDELLSKAAAYMSRTAVGAELAPATSTSKKHKQKTGKGRMSEKEEDDVMLHSLEDEADSAPVSYPPLTEQPVNITGKMRAYQLEGLNWMIRLYDSGVSGILADEMGLGQSNTMLDADNSARRTSLRCSLILYLCFVFLSRCAGKTLQSISLLAYLKGVRGVRGPHLVLTPLSTLGNWHREFTRWCPELRVCRFHGTREERAEMIARGDLGMETYDILLTSYEMAIREKNHINRTQWCFIG